MIKEKLKKVEIKFVGEFGWEKLRDLLVLKCNECENEKDFGELIEYFISSMFSNVKELDETRRKLGIKLLKEKEKNELNELLNKK